MSTPADSPPGVGNNSALRWANRQRLLGALAAGGSLSQAELSRETGLSAAAVSSLVKDLAGQDVVVVSPGVRGGRRVTEVALAGTHRVVVGVDLGHRHVRVAAADSSGTILAEVSEPRAAKFKLDDDVVLLAELRDRVLAEAAIDAARVAIVAIGVPVPLQQAARRPGPLARGWSDLDVRSSLSSALGVPVVLDNDANLGALGEARRGAGRGCGDFVYVKAAHGLGAGLVLGSRLYQGGLGAAGEIGHMSVNDTGPLCSCGGRGCLELYAGGRAIAAALAEVHGSRPTLKQIVERCREGEPSFVRAVEDAGRHLGVVLGNVANLLAPQRIILGGELSQSGETLIDAVRRAVGHGSATTLTDRVEVVTADLGSRSELLGAVELGISQLHAQLGIPVVDGLSGVPDDARAAI